MNVVFRSSEKQTFTGFYMLVVCLPAECALNGIESSFFGAIYTIILYIQSAKELQIYSVVSVSAHVQKKS